MEVHTLTMQPNLFDRAAESRFQQYHAENPQIYRMFCQFALQLIRSGARHIGSKQIIERVRFESAVRAMDGEFKVNNNMTPFYARQFMRDFPEYKGLFATRRSVADVEVS